MEINCEYAYDLSKGYSCFITTASITEKDHEIKEFKGAHRQGNSHKTVRSVWFDNTTVNYFPRGLERHFPNLTHFNVSNCPIKEISKDDLKGLEGLYSLHIGYCQLTSLPDDLFTEMPNLRSVSFRGNKIEFASSEFLKPLLGRKSATVNLRENKNIDADYWPEFISLEALMELIDEKCIKPAPAIVSHPEILAQQVKDLWLSGKFSDLTIIAGWSKFKVHKAILGMKSEVLDKILEEKSEAAEIKLSEFSSHSVEALLKFIYTNEASENGNANENFEIADKFKVEAMKLFYEKIICDQINDENAWETFLFAHRLSSQLLKEKAFKQIVKQIPDKVPDKLMEDPENLKKLIDHRKAYDKILRM